MFGKDTEEEELVEPFSSTLLVLIISAAFFDGCNLVEELLEESFFRLKMD